METRKAIRAKPRRPSGFHRHLRKKCRFCTERITIDYKNVGLLRSFVSERGKILPAYVTGTCARHQRQITQAIKRARMLALLPFTVI